MPERWAFADWTASDGTHGGGLVKVDIPAAAYGGPDSFGETMRARRVAVRIPLQVMSKALTSSLGRHVTITEVGHVERGTALLGEWERDVWAMTLAGMERVSE